VILRGLARDGSLVALAGAGPAARFFEPGQVQQAGLGVAGRVVAEGRPVWARDVLDDPDITLGVWIGLDQKRPIGHNQTGSEAALPVWMDVMKAWIGNRTTPPTFDPPGNIVFVPVDKVSGGPVLPGTPGAITEAFIAGTQPGGFKQ